MSWTAPRTWVAGEVLTAALMNQQLRDNAAELRDPPMVHVYRGADQTGIATAVWTAVSWDTALRNVHGMWSSVTNPTRWTIAVDGTYEVTFIAEWIANATGSRGTRVLKNGATIYNLDFSINNGASVWRRSGTVPIRCVAGDYLECQVDQTSGGNLTLNGGQQATSGFAKWIAP